jgi:hypothetical protein
MQASWSKDSAAYCVLLWFGGWTLDTRAKYAMGVLLVFAAGASNEAFLVARRKFTLSRWRVGSELRHVVDAALYGLQMILAYLLMLVVMTYEIVLFVALVLGLATGHYCFHRYLNTPANSVQLIDGQEKVDQAEAGSCCQCPDTIGSKDQRQQLLATSSTPCCGGSGI